MGSTDAPCLGPEPTALLTQVALRLHAARCVLAPLTTSDEVIEVEHGLIETDDLFRDVVRCPELGSCAAQHIELLRDDLSSHLEAARVLRGAGAPAVTVLRRGVESACSRLDSALMAGTACGCTATPGTCPMG